MKSKNQTKKNEIYNIKITDINNLGCGVGRINDVVTFVSGGCTGDELAVKIIKVASDYNVGRIEEIITPSPYRTSPDCSVSKRCGGCVYRHITYEHELTLKRGRVAAAMRKVGLDVDVCEVLCVGITEGYRNKAQYPIGRTKDGKTAIGFFAERSHDIIPCTYEGGSCALQPKIFGEIADFVKVWMDENKLSAYDEVSRRGVMRHLYLRFSESQNEVMVCFVVNTQSEKVTELARAVSERFPTVASIYENLNHKSTNVVLGSVFRLLFGKEKLTDSLCGRNFEISPQSFWQVNRLGAELLYSKAAELASLKGGERVIDLFCGIGTVGMSVCGKDTKLYGIEIVPEAVENAKENAVRNGFHNAEFLCLDASRPDEFVSALEEISKDGIDVVLLDPPRKGCSPELLDTIKKFSAKKIVYISCNPDTLARDIKFLSDSYSCDKVTPVDMFPRTGHCETVVLLSRQKVDEHIHFEVNVADLPKTTRTTATYTEIKDYIQQKYGFKVSTLYIAQTKDKCGLAKRDNYNIGEGKSKDLVCPAEKEKAILDAFKHFGML